jgi:hypothetical protein
MTHHLPEQGISPALRPQFFRFACLSFGALVLSLLPGLPARAVESESPARSVDQVVEQLPSDTQTTLLVCRDQGGVDLVAGANQEGSAVCGDGVTAPVEYERYLTTVSDFMTAGVLVGFRSAIEADPRITPGLLVAVLATPEGTTAIRGATETAIARSNLITSTPESVSLLTDEVMNRLLPAFQATNNLETLLGTQEQYALVVQNFCNAPGLSLDQAQQMIPGLIPIQLYAICIQESGVVENLQQQSN